MIRISRIARLEFCKRATWLLNSNISFRQKGMEFETTKSESKGYGYVSLIKGDHTPYLRGFVDALLKMQSIISTYKPPIKKAWTAYLKSLPEPKLAEPDDYLWHHWKEGESGPAEPSFEDQPPKKKNEEENGGGGGGDNDNPSPVPK